MPKKTTESGWKIPQDWDGETWRCITLHWPDSIDFERMLYGLLYDLTRAPSYDKFTGDLNDAKGMGWKIWNKNIPPAACEDCPDCEECPPDRTECPPGRGGGLVILGDETMAANGGGVVTGIDVTPEGKLRVFYGHCCYDDLDLPIGGGEDTEGDLVNPDGDPEYEYSSCGKAYALMNVLNKIVEGGYDALDENLWNYVSTVEHFVGYNLSDKYVIALVTSWAVVFTELGLSYGDIYDAAEQQQILCELTAHFGDDGIGVPTDDDKATIRGIILGAFGVNIVKGELYAIAIDALGRKNMDTVVKLGAGDTTRDCECPGDFYNPTETEPDENGWYLTVDKKDGLVYQLSDSGHESIAYWIGVEAHDVYGVYFRLNVPPSSGQTARMNQTQVLSYISAWVAQDVNVTGTSSDQLQAANQSYPFIQIDAQPIAVSLALYRGDTGFTRLTGGVDAAGDINAPDWPAGESGALIMECVDELIANGWITEVRWVQNINSPSHSA
jgi:hypothetical protein